MKKIIYIVMLAVLLSGCGVKKGYVVGDYGKQPLCGEVVGPIESADSSLAGRSTLGLWWQRDSLQITLNQGRRLKAARAKGDTLYLYETQHDTMDVATRQYTLYIPQQELLIIKYNDSLVYPIMPSVERCEYPLEIKSMGVKNIIMYNKIIQESIESQRKSGLWGGMHDLSCEPLELRAGTYLYNAGSYSYGTDCECKTDSAKVLILNVDGTWQQYENDKMMNCGIMRKFLLPTTYEAFNYRDKIVYFSDTISIRFLEGEEWKRRK